MLLFTTTTYAHSVLLHEAGLQIRIAYVVPQRSRVLRDINILENTFENRGKNTLCGKIDHVKIKNLNIIENSNTLKCQLKI